MGVPVAVLEPAGPKFAKEPAKIIEQIRALRKGKRLGDLSLKKMIEQGRQSIKESSAHQG